MKVLGSSSKEAAPLENPTLMWEQMHFFSATSNVASQNTLFGHLTPGVFSLLNCLFKRCSKAQRRRRRSWRGRRRHSIEVTSYFHFYAIVNFCKSFPEIDSDKNVFSLGPLFPFSTKFSKMIRFPILLQRRGRFQLRRLFVIHAS